MSGNQSKRAENEDIESHDDQPRGRRQFEKDKMSLDWPSSESLAERFSYCAGNTPIFPHFCICLLGISQVKIVQQGAQGEDNLMQCRIQGCARDLLSVQSKFSHFHALIFQRHPSPSPTPPRKSWTSHCYILLKLPTHHTKLEKKGMNVVALENRF